MKSQTLSITILSITAALMLAAHIFIPTSAQASFAIKDRDYQVVSARITSGGDGIYILDNKTAQLAVFTYDPAARAVRARVKRPIAEAFTATP
jgi:hypothetical protein